jgi:biopolymer transport protein ExbD
MCMRNRLLDFSAMTGSIAAAAAAAVLGIFAPLFLVPQPIVCGFVPSYTPTLEAGDLYLLAERPETVLVSVAPDGAVLLGPNRVRAADLAHALIDLRQRRSGDPLELNVHGSVTLGQLAPVFSAIRAAGYDSFFVFGPERSLLQVFSLSHGHDSSLRTAS